MKIIKKPIRSGSDRAFRADCFDNCMIRCAQRPIVVLKARAQPSPGLELGCRALGGGEALGMLFQSLDAE